MSTRIVSFAILDHYPETSPWALDPVPYNLTPCPWQDEEDSPGLIEMAREQTHRTHINPFFSMFGTNPLIIYDEQLQYAETLCPAYKQPPPVPEASLGDDVEFLQLINRGGNCPIYTVRVGSGDIKLLKIVSSRMSATGAYLLNRMRATVSRRGRR